MGPSGRNPRVAWGGQARRAGGERVWDEGCWLVPAFNEGEDGGRGCEVCGDEGRLGWRSRRTLNVFAQYTLALLLSWSVSGMYTLHIRPSLRIPSVGLGPFLFDLGAQACDSRRVPRSYSLSSLPGRREGESVDDRRVSGVGGGNPILERIWALIVATVRQVVIEDAHMNAHDPQVPLGLSGHDPASESW